MRMWTPDQYMRANVKAPVFVTKGVLYLELQ